MRDCANVSALARELEVDRTVLYHSQSLIGEQWTDSTATSPVRELRKQVRDLKRLLAENTLEVDFFKRCLAKSRFHWRWCSLVWSKDSSASVPAGQYAYDPRITRLRFGEFCDHAMAEVPSAVAFCLSLSPVDALFT
jgi:hypothetical protein